MALGQAYHSPGPPTRQSNPTVERPELFEGFLMLSDGVTGKATVRDWPIGFGLVGSFIYAC